MSEQENVIEATDESFDEVISGGITLVDFWAEWCGPCKTFIPVLEDLASKNENIKVIKVDVEKCPDTASKMNIRSVPTITFFKDGDEGHSLIGSHSLEELQAEIDMLKE